jgi:hypothetical protein
VEPTSHRQAFLFVYSNFRMKPGDPAWSSRKHKFLTGFGKKALYRGPTACYLPQKLANTVALVFGIKG